MAIDITTDNKALSYADLICISNLLLAYSLEVSIKGQAEGAKLAINFAQKIHTILKDMEA